MQSAAVNQANGTRRSSYGLKSNISEAQGYDGKRHFLAKIVVNAVYLSRKVKAQQIAYCKVLDTLPTSVL